LSDAHIRLPVNTNCRAKSNAGFTFTSWSENLRSHLNNVIIPPSSYYTLSHALLSSLGFGEDDNSTLLPIDHSGNFTANFQANPQPIPQDYLIGIYSLAATVFTG
jgi:hypothetical protein